MEITSYRASASDGRLDLFLKTKIKNKTRTYIKKLILEGNVVVNGVIVKKPSFRLKEGSLLEVGDLEPKKLNIKSSDYDLEIIYEDDSVAVINKPAGMVVHPGKGNYEDTLVNVLAGKISNLSGIGGIERPGIVHRLDKDTSGIMLVAKNDFSHNAIANAFKEREINKTYLAVCYGIIGQEKWSIEGFIKRDPKTRIKMIIMKTDEKEAGKYSLTDFKTIKHIEGKATVVKVAPLTGRTHQIRVSLLETGFPIVGDKVYKRKDITEKYKSLNFIKRQMLHAYTLEFPHPLTGKKMFFKANIPQDMTWAFNSLNVNDL